MRLATTRGTNALLERRGARTVHFTTAGFEDLLTIGDQQRPDLFALHIEKPEPLPELVVGVRERLAADGSVTRRPSTGTPSPRASASCASEGLVCASIALLHGHRNPAHEEMLEEMLVEARGSSTWRGRARLSPFQGLLRRSVTCSVEAYLGPVITDYLRAVESRLGAHGSSLHVMTSAGGLIGADTYRSTDSLLSGPAGGVVGTALTGRRSGRDRVIAFDMGGTSTDVARYDGDFEYVFSHRVGPVELAVPALAIETVAAGGGSICRVEQGRSGRGPAERRRRAGPGELRRRRTADPDRRQPPPGPPGRREVPDPHRPGGRPGPDSGSCGGSWRRRTAGRAATRRSSRACCGSPTSAWPRPSATSRSARASTRRGSLWSPSAAPVVSTPAGWPSCWGWRRSCCPPTPAC